MARSAERARSRPPVIAVAVTVGVCTLGHFVYNRLVFGPATATATAQSGGVEGEGPQVETDTTRTSGQNRELGAALLRALAAAKADEPRQECSPTHVPEPTEEEAERAAALSDARDAEGVSERARRFMKADVAALEAELRAEKIDAEWAKKTEQAATRAIAATTTGMRLDEVTCRSTFCRARVTHADASMRGSDVTELLRFPELSVQMLPYVPVEEEETTVLYFAREGHTLSVMSSDAPASSQSAGPADRAQGSPGSRPAPTSDRPPPADLAGG